MRSARCSRNRYPRWTVGLNISYPIGTSTQDAAVARARVQLNQVEAQIKQIELQIATDITNAAISCRKTSEAVQAAQAARELRTQRLEAEQSKFEVGMSTNYFVVQAQRDLERRAQQRAARHPELPQALVEFERLQQTTLHEHEHHDRLGGAWRAGGDLTCRALTEDTEHHEAFDHRHRSSSLVGRRRPATYYMQRGGSADARGGAAAAPASGRRRRRRRRRLRRPGGGFGGFGGGPRLPMTVELARSSAPTCPRASPSSAT